MDKTETKNIKGQIQLATNQIKEKDLQNQTFFLRLITLDPLLVMLNFVLKHVMLKVVAPKLNNRYTLVKTQTLLKP